MYNYQELELINQLLHNLVKNGINIINSSGDLGSGNGYNFLNVNLFASSPYVTGIGGTSFYNTNGQEIVWGPYDNIDAGSCGGFSSYFDKPSYQNYIFSISSQDIVKNAIKRGIPDLSLNADPNSGVLLYYNNHIPNQLIGGTSFSTPLFAGLIASLELNYGNIGLTPTIYNAYKFFPNIFNEITIGNNDTVDNSGQFYIASKGWNPCTGLGSFNGEKLARALYILTDISCFIKFLSFKQINFYLIDENNYYVSNYNNTLILSKDNPICFHIIESDKGFNLYTNNNSIEIDNLIPKISLSNYINTIYIDPANSLYRKFIYNNLYLSLINGILQFGQEGIGLGFVSICKQELEEYKDYFIHIK